ncbi:MAG TPA: hypothetical protein VHV99_09440 [Paraburkholderia sp.]|nr:hypothetical protein [Paraburkholderia sp.]
MANPAERKGQSPDFRAQKLYAQAKTAVGQTGWGAFRGQSWMEAGTALSMSALGKSTITNGVQSMATSGMATAAASVAVTGISWCFPLLRPIVSAAAHACETMSWAVENTGPVGEAAVGMVSEKIEELIWGAVAPDGMDSVNTAADTANIDSKELLENLKEQLVQIVATMNVATKFEQRSATYCDELYRYALMVESMKDNIVEARKNAKTLHKFLGKVVKILPDDAAILQMETSAKKAIAAKLDSGTMKHYNGAWISGRHAMCSNVHCWGAA